MNKELLYQGLEGITDQDWRISGIISDSESSMHPEYITPVEAKLLKLVGVITPAKLMPFIVRQFAGQDGEKIFIEILEASKTDTV